MRLRARLLSLIVVALIPAVAVQLYFAREARMTREAADRAEVVRLARLVAADLESVVEGVRQFLGAIASIEAVATGEVGSCTTTLRALAQDNPRYATLSVTDQTGRIICSATPIAVGIDISGLPQFRLARETGGFAMGEYAIGRGTGRQSLHFGLPLPAARYGREGVVIAALDLQWLGQRLAEVPLPPGGSVLVADRKGIVLGHWPNPEHHVGQAAPAAMLRTLQADKLGAEEYVGLDGVRRFHAALPLGKRPTGLSISVGRDPSQAEAEVSAISRQTTLLILAAGLVALGLGLLAARRFMEQPVEALVRAMERWRAGDPATRVCGDPRFRGLGKDNEFRRIAASFDQAAAAVEEREAQFRQIGEALEDGLAITETKSGRLLYASPGFCRLAGVPPDALPERLIGLLPLIHPEDRTRVRRIVIQPQASAFDIEYRVRRPDGTERRVRHRRFLVCNLPVPRTVNIFSDVTEERQATERQMLLAREVDHRAKNILSVVQSVLRLTRSDNPRSFARAVEGRVAALARAHALLANSRWRGADLAQLLQEEFAPYTADGGRGSRSRLRVVFEGPPVRLRPEAVQPIAMVVHELATNSAKYGALSCPEGVLRATWAVKQHETDEAPWLELHWTESGGPRVEGPPARPGFGSRVVQTTVEQQLGGKVAFAWLPQGLECVLQIPAASVLQQDGGITAKPVPAMLPAL